MMPANIGEYDPEEVNFTIDNLQYSATFRAYMRMADDASAGRKSVPVLRDECDDEDFPEIPGIHAGLYELEIKALRLALAAANLALPPDDDEPAAEDGAEPSRATSVQ
jgi:hypothetical protein